MNRRTFLASVGAGAVAGGTGLAGCLGGGGGADLPPDENPDDGYPPAFDEVPEERSIDTDAFDTVFVDDVSVPLAPIDAAHYWYRRREARFADARGGNQYQRSHVYGAVLSPAPNGLAADDPVSDWPTGDRVVCYCGCPHHLSSLRAASLISAGYERVYVIDEGFWEWHDRGYPMAGSEVSVAPSVAVIRGRTDPRLAGESAWAVHPPTGQREAAPIAPDGSYRLELRFADVTASSTVVVRTPAYRVAAPLGELVGTVVTGEVASG